MTSANAFVLEMCFVEAESGAPHLGATVRSEMRAMFGESFLHVDEKIAEGAVVVTAEVRGVGEWQDEDELARYVERAADDGLIERLYGYRIELHRTKRGRGGCRNCE
jgi:hypothetical protein